jgi:hypothetical protein
MRIRTFLKGLNILLVLLLVLNVRRNLLKNGTSGLWNAGVLQFAIHKPAHQTQVKIKSLSYCENIICRQLPLNKFTKDGTVWHRNAKILPNSEVRTYSH